MTRLDQITFDAADANLFQVDDPRLRADALKHSVLPRLFAVFNECVTLIRTIYGVEALTDSHLAYSPQFRTRRTRELGILYTNAGVGLEGKRVGNKWHGVHRPDGREVKIVPYGLRLLLDQSGLSLALYVSEMRLADECFRQVFDFLGSQEPLVHALCHAASVRPDIYIDRGQPWIRPLSHSLQYMADHRLFDLMFSSDEDAPFPVSGERLSRLVESFAYLFPIYDSFLQLAIGLGSGSVWPFRVWHSNDLRFKLTHYLGLPPRFEMLVDRANTWMLDGLENTADAVLAVTPAADELVAEARRLAELRVKVMPALRWQVFQRDGWRCVACGRGSAQQAILQVDHIVPRSLGGPDALDNYQTLCDVCNIGKSNRDSTDLRAAE